MATMTASSSSHERGLGTAALPGGHSRVVGGGVHPALGERGRDLSVPLRVAT